MKLSIITINYNNALGLEKTMNSVFGQTCKEFEYIIVDGASIDGSINVIMNYELQLKKEQWPMQFRYVSESDCGIYNAMNKGIQMTSGDFIQILNSGDCLASNAVVKSMYEALEKNSFPDILYGNMIKVDGEGKVLTRSGKIPYSLLQFYSATLNHDCAYINKELFADANYGLYDESLKIVSDWKWYLQAIGLGKVKPIYVDVDITIFDAGGISELNLDLRNRERRQVLEKLLPPAILADYDLYGFGMQQLTRLKRYPWVYKVVWLLERSLFKWEKWSNKGK